jgi:hypothetical protein
VPCVPLYTLPLSGDIKKPLHICPKCHSPWTRFGESSFELEAEKLVQAVSDTAWQKKLGCLLTLEITPEQSHENMPSAQGFTKPSSTEI